MTNYISFILDQLGHIDYERTPNRLALYADLKQQTRLRMVRERYNYAQIDSTIRNIDFAVSEIETNFDAYCEYYTDETILAGYHYGPRTMVPERSALPERRRARQAPRAIASFARVLAVALIGVLALGAGGAGALYLLKHPDLFERTEAVVATNDSFEDIVVFFDQYRQRLEDFRSKSKDDVYPISKSFVAFGDLEGFVATKLKSEFPIAAGLAEISGELRYKSDGKGFKLVAVDTGLCSPLLLVRPELADPRRSNEPYDCAAFGIWNEDGAQF